MLEALKMYFNFNLRPSWYDEVKSNLKFVQHLFFFRGVIVYVLILHSSAYGYLHKPDINTTSSLENEQASSKIFKLGQEPGGSFFIITHHDYYYSCIKISLCLNSLLSLLKHHWTYRDGENEISFFVNTSTRHDGIFKRVFLYYTTTTYTCVDQIQSIWTKK